VYLLDESELHPTGRRRVGKPRKRPKEQSEVRIWKSLDVLHRNVIDDDADNIREGNCSNLSDYMQSLPFPAL
jgi:hypothetical protein